MAEEQLTVEVGGRTLKISNLGKVMYPGSGTTKGEVLHYYATVAPVLPALKRASSVPSFIRRMPMARADSFFRRAAVAASSSIVTDSEACTTSHRAA